MISGYPIHRLSHDPAMWTKITCIKWLSQISFAKHQLPFLSEICSQNIFRQHAESHTTIYTPHIHTHNISVSMSFFPMNISYKVESFAVTLKSIPSGSARMKFQSFHHLRLHDTFIFHLFKPGPLSVTVPSPCFAYKTQVAVPQSSPITFRAKIALSSLTTSLLRNFLP